MSTLFSDRANAGFSTMKLWNSLGNVTILVMGKRVSFWIKTIIVASGLVLSMIFVVILNLYKRKNKYEVL